MKTRPLKLLGSVLFTVMLLSGFSQHPNKKEVAEKKVLAFDQHKMMAIRNDSINDLQKFKKISLFKIKTNTRNLEDLKTRPKNTNEGMQKSYDARILNYEKQNNELKEAVLRSGEIHTSKWIVFKRDFNNIMDSLSKAIREMKGTKA